MSADDLMKEAESWFLLVAKIEGAGTNNARHGLWLIEQLEAERALSKGLRDALEWDSVTEAYFHMPLNSTRSAALAAYDATHPRGE